jgi:hypothetical protein
MASWYERALRLWRSRTPREWVFAPVYYFLRDRESRIGVRLLGGGLFFPGLGVFIYCAVAFPGRIDLPANAATTRSIRASGDSFYGGSYIIRVEGGEYECLGSDYRDAFEVDAPIQYDPLNPSHCRHAKLVGKLSRWEWLELIRSALGLGLGLGLCLIRKEDENRFRLYLSHALVVVGLLGQVVFWPAIAAADHQTTWELVLWTREARDRQILLKDWCEKWPERGGLWAD